ncbi:MAG: hypothetical protein AB7I38_12955 [Dehalococcoidia bacterium]
MTEQLTADGVNGLVELDGDTVRIWVKGTLSLVNPDMMRCREIYLGDIASIQYRDAGLITHGYIQFTHFGGGPRARVDEAVRNGNAVMFRRRQQPDFDAIYDAIEDARRNLRSRMVRPTDGAP